MAVFRSKTCKGYLWWSLGAKLRKVICGGLKGQNLAKCVNWNAQIQLTFLLKGYSSVYYHGSVSFK